MIISCTSCNTKFEINSDLIHESGRLLQCSKCNHQWFFTRKHEKEQITTTIDQLNTQEDTDYNLENNEIIEDESIDQIKDESIDNKKDKITKSKSKIKFKYKFINLILVFIISSIALIIVIDTFKSPLSLIIPNIEIILYHLYETLKDIMLFLKDLFK